MQKRGYHDFPLTIFCLTVPKRITRGTLRCFRRIQVSKIFMHTRSRGLLRFSVEKLLSHSTETFRRGTFLCFRKFRVSKNSMDRRGREYHDIPSKNFGPTGSKISKRDTSVIQKISGIEKFYTQKGHITIFRKMFFLCHSTGQLRRRTLLFFR